MAQGVRTQADPVRRGLGAPPDRQCRLRDRMYLAREEVRGVAVFSHTQGDQTEG